MRKECCCWLRTGRMLIDSVRPRSRPQKLLPVLLTRRFAFVKSVSFESCFVRLSRFESFVSVLENDSCFFVISICSFGILSIHNPSHFKHRCTEAVLCTFVPVFDVFE